VNDALRQDNGPICLTVDAHGRNERVPRVPKFRFVKGLATALTWKLLGCALEII
jgi:hypothetical protein